ncbi:MAG: response regulator [Deltaproteobacteria bacterium]|nr:response regulator [Deltaproteobacteria bacterium]
MLTTESHILIITGHPVLQLCIKEILTQMGFSHITMCPSYAVAIHRLVEQNYQLVIFDTIKSDMNARDFVRHLSSFDERCIRVAMSNKPELKLVLDLLEAGIQGFLIYPFTIDTVREVFDIAKDAPQLNKAIFDSVNRIATFKALMLSNLNRLAQAKKDLLLKGSTQEDIAELERDFIKSVAMAKEVAAGNDDELLNQIIEGCLRAAKMPPTRLRNIRRHLRDSGVLKNATKLEEDEPTNKEGSGEDIKQSH